MTLMILPRLAMAALAFSSTASPLARKLNVVTTTPDLGAIARQIGGDAVEVKTLAKPSEDPHFVDAKPSHIVTLNRADILIEGGAELEMGWLPPLLESARNSRIGAGSPGLIIASQGIHMLQVPATLDRSRGDVHSLGNPHFFIDPVSAKIVAGEIAAHLAQVAPSSAPLFRANLAAFNSAVDSKYVEWQKLLAPYRGAKIVTYHNDFVYFADRFNLQIVETLEPKPGIAPSPAHVARVIATMNSQNARVILVQPYQNRRTAETVARQTNATVVDVSQQPGAIKGTDTYVQLMDTLVRSIASALQTKR